MFRMNITVVHNFVLLILYWTCDTIKTDLITVCEKMSANISCKHGTKIQIQGMQYGPLSLDNSDYGAGMKERLPTSNSTTLEILCNDRSFCYLNGSEIFEFDKYQDISRLINITYYCDFEYYGCYEDDKNRLFTGGSEGLLDVNTMMSALICRNFCSAKKGTRPYFGTEAGYVCFCGMENEIDKLNSTSYPNYKRHDKVECNSICNGHVYETCGQDGLISVYTTETNEDEYQVLASLYKPNETVTLGAVIGSISTVCLICGSVIGFYMYKRKHHQKNTSTTTDTQQYADLEATHTDQKYDDLTFTTQYEDLDIENQYHNMASVDNDHNYDELNTAA